MAHFDELTQLLGRHEGQDLEFKSARGGLPVSLWETYSAMANTEGGAIVLGVSDDSSIVGLTDPGKMRKQFWDTVNNRGKVSVNLLHDDDVVEHVIAGRVVIWISVPRADRRQRPVYVGQNPLIGTYRRNFEGDYRCSEQEVGRMLADRGDEPADAKILEGFSFDDLDEASIQQYRQRFSARTPDHPWLSEDLAGFLGKLGAWRKSRRRPQEGVTVAGLLMFGKVDAIRSVEAVPEYHLDYRERLSEDAAVRWTDRLTVDGTWEANLFQFYQRVIQKISADLKLPFQLDQDLFRRGDTAVHEALREALVNGLIHADHRGEGGVVIEKFRDRIEVSNPGTLLVSFDQLLKGGVSECRNRSLQTMFMMIGAAEKAGSGIDKIRQGWQSQHWRLPRFEEQVQPSRIRLIMPMVSLMPDEVLTELRERFGASFAGLSENEVQAVVTARIESQVTNGRMREICREHAADLTKLLQGLVQRGFLEQFGQRRWSSYRLAEKKGGTTERSQHIPGDSSHIAADSSHMDGWDSSHRLEDMPQELLEQLRRIAQPAQISRRLEPEVTRSLIQELCSGRYLTAAQLGKLLDRKPGPLRDRFLAPMVAAGVLRLRYAGSPNRPDQAYTAA